MFTEKLTGLLYAVKESMKSNTRNMFDFPSDHQSFLLNLLSACKRGASWFIAGDNISFFTIAH